MVSIKSKTVTKYTYAERVLGAFSQVQKKHRRHTVHQATLRAQVKKTAREKKDTLGPQWSNWVGKAVHKLEEEGILAPSEAAGNVILTPNGKNAIAAARRNLSIPTHGTLSTEEEDRIWKHVIQQASGCGLKRARVSSESIRDEESEKPEESSSPFSDLNNVPSKRTRSSQQANVKRPVNKMSKKELQTELKSLQQAHAEVLWRATSPLTELEDEETGEVARLMDELKRREELVETMRRELIQSKRLGASEARRHLSEGPLIFEPMPDFSTSSRTQSSHSRSMSRSKSMLGSIRAYSRSIIPVLSKQTTPAPSSPCLDTDDHGYSDMPYDLNGDILAISSGADMDNNPNIVAEAENRDTCALDKITSLERTLDMRDTELSQLEKTLSQLRSDYTQRGFHISNLESEVEELKKQVFDQGSEISLKGAQATALEWSGQARVQVAESLASEGQVHLASQRISNATLQEERNTLESNLRKTKETTIALEEQIATQLIKIADMERTIAESKSFQATTTNRLAQTTAENKLLSEQLRDAEAHNESLLEQLTASTDEKSAVEAALTATQGSVEAIKIQLATLEEVVAHETAAERELKDRLSASQSDGDRLREEVAILDSSTKNLDIQLKAAERRSDELKAECTRSSEICMKLSSDLEDKEKAVAELVALLTEARSSIAELSQNVHQYEQRADDLKHAMHTAATRLKTVEEIEQNLKEELTVKTEELWHARSNFSAAESMSESLEAAIEVKDGEIQSLRSRIEMVEARARGSEEALESALAKSAADGANHESVLLALRQSLTSAQNEAASFGSQLDCLQGAHGQIQSMLEEATSDLAATRAALNSETLRASALEKDIVDFTHKNQEAEDEITVLKSAKEADEATIDCLKAMFESLRQIQTQSLAELESKVFSVHSSPIPKRRKERMGPS